MHSGVTQPKCELLDPKMGSMRSAELMVECFKCNKMDLKHESILRLDRENAVEVHTGLVLEYCTVQQVLPVVYKNILNIACHRMRYRVHTTASMSYCGRCQ
jgi:hypothetical protein